MSGKQTSIQENFSGLFVVNKPSGMTSHDVVYRVRRLSGVKKVGHTGTLDPLAQGVLLMLLGKATKKASEFSGLDKEYLIEVVFGKATDTFDAEGEIVEEMRDKKILGEIDASKIKKTLLGFKGEMDQQVPWYSAVKVGGKKLYNLARKGKTKGVVPPTRKVKIHKVKLVELTGDVFPIAKIQLSCSSGFYTRSFCVDLGKKLGVPAYQKSLIRLRVGDFLQKQALDLKDLSKEKIIKNLVKV